jgi:hypothetical protein
MRALHLRSWCKRRGGVLQIRNNPISTAHPRGQTRAGLLAAALHLVLLAFTVLEILNAGEAPWTGYWIKFLALDFPVSIGVIPLAWLFPASERGPLHDFPNFWWPLAYHSSIGTLWWYVAGRLVAVKILSRTR